MKKLEIRDIMFFVVLLILVFLTVFSQTRNEEEIFVGVHIKGEVNAPGYYELEYGKRIKDLIKCAGGETKKADLNAVNLALALRDGEEITIPAKGKDISDAKSDKININTADSYQLCKIDKIGEVLANRIIEYRAKHGSFKTIEEIKKVEGIGESNFEKIKDKITV